MITKDNERMSVGGGFLSVEEFYGLSTDTKPTNTANGSTFFEMDTGKMYRFNYSGTTWTETTHYGGDGFGPTPSGGGGGTSGDGVLVVHNVYDDQTFTHWLDKTWQEIYDALLSGTIVVIVYDMGSNYAKIALPVEAYLDTGVYYVSDHVDANYATDSADGYPAMED